MCKWTDFEYTSYQTRVDNNLGNWFGYILLVVGMNEFINYCVWISFIIQNRRQFAVFQQLLANNKGNIKAPNCWHFFMGIIQWPMNSIHKVASVPMSWRHHILQTVPVVCVFASQSHSVYPQSVYILYITLSVSTILSVHSFFISVFNARNSPMSLPRPPTP